MNSYKITDRLTEWTSWAGVLVAGIGGALPHLVDAGVWTTALTALLPGLGAALFFVPQTPRMQKGEAIVLSGLQMLDADLPPTYQTALSPIVTALAAKLATAPVAVVTPSATATVIPAPQPAVAPGGVAATLGMVVLLLGGFALSACSVTASDVATYETSLTSAETLATVYAALPACTGSNAPLCSDPTVVADIKTADTAAYAALQALQAGTGTAAEVEAAIAALTTLIPATTPAPAPTVTPAPTGTTETLSE